MIDALAQQIGERMLNGRREAQVGETTAEPPAQPDARVGGSQQHDAAVRRDGAAVERAHKFAPARPSKVQLALATLCRHRGTPPAQTKSLSQKHFR